MIYRSLFGSRNEYPGGNAMKVTRSINVMTPIRRLHAVNQCDGFQFFPWSPQRLLDYFYPGENRSFSGTRSPVTIRSMVLPGALHLPPVGARTLRNQAQDRARQHTHGGTKAKPFSRVGGEGALGLSRNLVVSSVCAPMPEARPARGRGCTCPASRLNRPLRHPTLPAFNTASPLNFIDTSEPRCPQEAEFGFSFALPATSPLFP